MIPEDETESEFFENFLTNIAGMIYAEIVRNLDENHDFYLIISSEDKTGYSCVITNRNCGKDVINMLEDEITLMKSGDPIAASGTTH